MTEINVVTTFSHEGYKLYGRKCLESFVKYWPADTQMWAFADPPLEKYDFSPILGKGINIRSLAAETDFITWASDWGWCPTMSHPTDYRFQGVRFAHKVFAMTADCLPKSGIRVWLDADTETIKPIDREYLERCFPGPDEWCSYLGRTQWHHSETGWLAFKLNQNSLPFLRDFLDVYKSGHIVTLQETHDAWAFDWMRLGLVGRNDNFRNLSPNAIGLDAWNHSPLGERMIHRKGNLKLA